MRKHRPDSLREYSGASLRNLPDATVREVRLMLNRKDYRLISVLLMLLLASSPAVFSQEEKESKRKGAPQGKPVLWREPVDVKTRNLLLGPGGEAMKPASPE